MISGLKLTVKRLLAMSMSRVGSVCPSGWLEDVVSMRLSSYLMDERVLPRQVVPRRLRGTSAKVLCNPYIATHKRLFWCGRLEQKAIEAYMRRELRPGDTFIDVGSNYGHLSVLAACLVGDKGRVISFEANGSLANVMIEDLKAQRISNVAVNAFGLGEEEVSADLLVDTNRPGQSFVRGAAREAQPRHSQVMPCAIQRGDRALEKLELPGRVCLKVDVEGYEKQVLRGLGEALKNRIGHAILEVTPEWLGGSDGVEELFSIMRNAGFGGYELRANGSIGSQLTPQQIVEQTDVVFRK